MRKNTNSKVPARTSMSQCSGMLHAVYPAPAPSSPHSESDPTPPAPRIVPVIGGLWRGNKNKLFFVNFMLNRCLTPCQTVYTQVRKIFCILSLQLPASLCRSLYEVRRSGANVQKILRQVLRGFGIRHYNRLSLSRLL